MAGTGSELHVTVTLKDIDFHDPVPERTIVLRAPNWQVKIGRGTQSGSEGLIPAPNNAWFDSRVMSRSHAILRADPVTKEMLIEDLGSMHGTYLAGKRLGTNFVESLWPRDTLTMGADVTRGSSYFNALRVMLTWNWSDGSSNTNDPRSTYGNMYRNTFSADYSEEEQYDDLSSEILGEQEEDDYEVYEVKDHISEPDDEVQVIQDSIREPSVEIVVPQTRTFTVPESDDVSTGGSYASGEDVSDEESPTSSPVIPNNASGTKYTNNVKISALTSSYTIAPVVSTVNHDETDTSHASATSPADLIEVEGFPNMDEPSEADSYADDELDNDYSDPIGPTDISTFQVESAEPSSAALASSMDVTNQSEHVRPPSPSDAAMVKPLSEPSHSAISTAPPFPPYLQRMQQPVSMDNVAASGRMSSAWAGHNSVLYDSVPRPPALQQPASLYYPPYSAYPPVYTTPFTYQAPAISTLAPPLSPLSIASLVQQQQPEEESKGSKKRKADQISSDDSCDADQASSELFSSEVGDFTATAAPRGVDSACSGWESALRSPQTSTLEVTENTTAEDVEPPRKKARKMTLTARGQRGSGFVKMAAATIVGMAIGAVGTVIGLAALPQDYFV